MRVLIPAILRGREVQINVLFSRPRNPPPVHHLIEIAVAKGYMFKNLDFTCEHQTEHEISNNKHKRYNDWFPASVAEIGIMLRTTARAWMQGHAHHSFSALGTYTGEELQGFPQFLKVSTCFQELHFAYREQVKQ